MIVIASLAAVSLCIWLYLLFGHGAFWRTDQRLPPAPDPPHWPTVVAVVPARDEADILPRTLPALVAQEYPGTFRVVVVDDASHDGTGARAVELSTSMPSPDAERLTVVRGSPTPAGWAGKVWAMSEGLADTGDAAFVLFVDADIALAPAVLARLVRVAEDRRLDLVSQMATLHAATIWGHALVPAFVYFFAQLYPFRRVNRPSARTAAAAGGCMLVRRAALDASGGIQGIRGALIDDVWLARMIKRRTGRGRLWLGHGGTDVVSVREHTRIGELWDMVARSAYTQLQHSPVLVVATVAALIIVYAVPPIAAIAGIVATVVSPSAAAVVCATCGLVAWAVMAVTYVPTLSLYRLAGIRAAALPAIAMLYAAMTVDSARRHRRGAGGAWKGRPPP